MRIDFVKMHGLGNDFIVIELPGGMALPSARQWRALADRHTGIGFDQALVVLPPRRAGTDAFYRVFNGDGGEVEQCGNGARCVAALLARGGPGSSATLTLDSAAGLVAARVLTDGRVSVEMGTPDFDPASLPYEAASPSRRYVLAVGDETVEFGAVSLGNPHAVLQVAAVEAAPVQRIGRALQANPRFPRQVNVGFMQVLDTGHIRLRVFERGAAETRACGTGACAAAVIGYSLGLLSSDVEVQMPGGILQVHWDGPDRPVWLTGPAQQVFEGRLELPEAEPLQPPGTQPPAGREPATAVRTRVDQAMGESR